MKREILICIGVLIITLLSLYVGFGRGVDLGAEAQYKRTAFVSKVKDFMRVSVQFNDDYFMQGYIYEKYGCGELLDYQTDRLDQVYEKYTAYYEALKDVPGFRPQYSQIYIKSRHNYLEQKNSTIKCSS